MSGGGLRFCMVTTFFPPYSFGGDGVFVQRLSDGLAERGHRVDVVHCVDSFRLLSSKMPDQGYSVHPGVTVHGLRSPWGALSPIATQQTGRPFFKAGRLRALLGRGYDVIHFHNVSLVGGPGVLTLGEGVKLYTLHEYWLVCPTHLLFRFGRAPCERRTCLTCTLVHRKPPQWWRYSRLLDKAAGGIDTFLAPSRSCMEEHRRRGFKGPMVHLPNFVPAETDAREAGPPPDGPYFLYAGRLERIKGVQDLIPLFKGGGGAELVVAGTGSYEPELRALAGSGKRIRFPGHLGGRELAAIVRGARALIVPSLVKEISPLVIFEAFRHKTPVIARDQGGMRELIADSGGGLTFATGEELQEAISRIEGDDLLRNELGRRGHEAYLDKWTAEVHLDRYLEIVEGHLRRRRGRGRA